MDQRTRAYAASGAIVGIFLLVQLGALALVGPFQSAGYQPVENPQNPANSVVYVALVVVMTGVALAVIRYGVERLLRVLMVGAATYLALFVLRVLVPPVLTVPVGGFGLNVLAWAGGAALGAALWVHPEWYVVDAAGVLMGAGGAALFGTSFGVLPALVLLAVLAVYDAVSVYGTEHMLTLASGVMELKVPVVLVVPLSLSYSYLDAGVPEAAERAGSDGPVADGGEGTETGGGGDRKAEAADGGPVDRNALFIGLGDAVIPTVLVASAAFFAPDSVPTVNLLGLPTALPAVTAMAGTVVGLLVLLRMVLRGRAHAGLPLLNGGAIAGYVLGALASGLSLVEALGLGPYV